MYCTIYHQSLLIQFAALKKFMHAKISYYIFTLQESPRLGPMELHLLSVVGTTKPVHRCESDGAAETDNEKGACKDLNKTDSDVWPVSEHMLHTLVIK